MRTRIKRSATSISAREQRRQNGPNQGQGKRVGLPRSRAQLLVGEFTSARFPTTRRLTPSSVRQENADWKSFGRLQRDLIRVAWSLKSWSERSVGTCRCFSINDEA